ncbi:MAG TPA: 4-(cytidine 5'-diphospho)-2-C-methyl-D-erythritol kinase [Oscillospiraceae bacterium]|nr:4-(cytidine 5'-diphospho)-2-C-methyl-D-erythritol kinase [Oscillospiraceae bacterium]
MESTVTVRTPAKINLTLDIVGKRTDGYHFMKTVMQSISIYDTVTLEQNTTGGITVFCNSDNVPSDETNTAYKAAKAFFEYAEIKNSGLEIIIDKKIPVQAGLAGGSADAAGVIVGLNELYNAELSVSELCEIGVKVGADVPFCIVGGTALAEGIGELLTTLPDLSDCFIVVAKGEKGISTAEAFEKIDSRVILNHPDCDGMIAAVASGHIPEIAPLCFNVFENVTSLSDIEEIKEVMKQNHALCAVMSGSGSSVFGIFEKKRYANACEDELSRIVDFVQICTPVSEGTQII